jgi:hypothetical protein
MVIGDDAEQTRLAVTDYRKPFDLSGKTAVCLARRRASAEALAA